MAYNMYEQEDKYSLMYDSEYTNFIIGIENVDCCIKAPK
jgi:hypothetical protein